MSNMLNVFVFIRRRLKELAAEHSRIPTNLQSSALKDQRSVLSQKIQDWQHIRAIYIPGLLQVLTDVGASPFHSTDSNAYPEDLDLWLPSAIPKDRRRFACINGLLEIESKLREAQCSSSLHGLRHVLRIKTRMIYFKNKNVRGQKEGTRSRAVIDRVHKRAIRLVHKYRVARRAKMELDGPGDWERMFQELRNEDVRSYTNAKKKTQNGRRGIWEDGFEPPAPVPVGLMESDEKSDEDASDIEMEEVGRQTDQQILKARKKGTGETRKEISWIWTTMTMNVESSEHANEILRSEWTKSRARTKRSREEVLLLLEEMRRVLEFLEWKAAWWDERQEGLMVIAPDINEGLCSYAVDQATLQRSLAASFRLLWNTPLAQIDAVVKEWREAEVEANGDDSEADGNDELADELGDGHNDDDAARNDGNGGIPSH